MNINSLKGIGPKTCKILSSNNINDTRDLINYYPFRFEILERSNINELNDTDRIVIDGISENVPNVYYFNKKMNKMVLRLNTGTNLFNVTIFNRAFLKNSIKPGTKITVIGKYDKLHNSITASDIKLSLLPNIPAIEPVYHSIGGISSKQIHNFIDEALKDEIEVIEYVPEYLKEKYRLSNKDISIKEIHNPTNKNQLKSATNYLKYEELFLFMMKMNYLKENKSMLQGLTRTVDYHDIEEFIDTLPFDLTLDQMSAVKHIYSDLISPKRMNRLIQGDVGSGKTIVAIIALYINFLGSYQGALMAPTEVLAQQHYKNLNSIFKNTKVKVELLTGKLKLSDKKEIYARLSRGEIDILIGTHALFSDDVKYLNLGLVITDEQHRFGVNQRSSFKNKGLTPDILYLSATPIPRTYAIALYGDMDISNITTVPMGRKEIITKLKKESEIREILELMHKQLKENHQIYVIAPQIEETDRVDLENVFMLKDKMTRAFGKICNIGIMHGKMTSGEKDEVMRQFKNNEISILISTTVIEVGIDVPNATMIVIFDSYRFGLSQLHQLRGRVGRGNSQSYCVLISDREAERLNILVSTSDGFKISEEDFKLRGSGDLFGVRQSGDMQFNIASIKQDFNILLHAKEDSLEVLKSADYINGNYPELRNIIEKSIEFD